MIIKLFTALYIDHNIHYFDEDSGEAIFNCSEIIILDINFNNISLDVKFQEDNPQTIILIRLLCFTNLGYQDIFAHWVVYRDILSPRVFWPWRY